MLGVSPVGFVKMGLRVGNMCQHLFFCRHIYVHAKW
jgi:hypothetical protein